MNDERINRLIARRNKLTNRRDENINRPAVAEIDAQLATIEPGQRNDVDLLLGRSCAKLPKRNERDDYLTGIADQHEDMLDFLNIRGDTAL